MLAAWRVDGTFDGTRDEAANSEHSTYIIHTECWYLLALKHTFIHCFSEVMSVYYYQYACLSVVKTYGSAAHL